MEKIKIANDGLYGVLESKKKEIEKKGKIRVLFLDCDGVINNMYQFRRGHGGIKLGKLGTGSVNNILPLNSLIKFLERNGYYLVYSTAWNIKGTDRVTECLEYICNAEMLNKVVLGCTPYIIMNNYSRRDEIKHFIDNAGVEIEKFAIVDDDNISGYDENFVKTDNCFGLLEYHVVKLMNILSDEKRMYL